MYKSWISMISRYREVDADDSLGTFLKSEKNENKNYYFFILRDSGSNNGNKNSKGNKNGKGNKNDNQKIYYIDIRTIGANITKSFDIKLKTLKKPLSISDTDDEKKNFLFLINSGERIIKTKSGFYDFIDALQTVYDWKDDFLKTKIEDFKGSQNNELFYLFEDDKISTAKEFFSKNKVNLLPVIDKENNVLGEVRNFDLIRSEFFLLEKRKSGYIKSNRNSNSSMVSSGSTGEYYDEDYRKSIHNLAVDSIMFKNPKIIESSQTIEKAFKVMIENKLPAIIVTKSGKIHSIITYKDVLKSISESLSEDKYVIEFQNTQDLFEDELELMKNFASTTMDKISRKTKYDNLHVNFKTHGNVEESHRRKFSLYLKLFHAKQVLTSHKEISEGEEGENFEGKIKEDWNIPKLFQSALAALEKKVHDEKDKIRDIRRR